MTVDNWEQVKELLHQAIALAPNDRALFLDEVCASDAGLRAKLESLLWVGDDLGADFLQSLSGDLNQEPNRTEATGNLEPGQVIAQRFQMIRKLGEGGMGQVWLAEQISPVRRQVALKLIKAGMYDEAVVQRFQSERQSLAMMDHPAIAKVFDAGTTPQGQPYFVMEYVPGLPITEYCDQRKLGIRERLELFIRACEGVQHAHQKAIIHRDLKPANILVMEVDGKAVPRIIDFGLAKAVTPGLGDQPLFTRFGEFMGTPGYISPEQVDPSIQDIDTRTDVYSMGAILYVLLTGMLPFETKRRQKSWLDGWMRQLREEEPPNASAKVNSDPETSAAIAAARGTAPKQLASLLRGDLDWITMKALERDRARRYGTPSELAADLRRHLNDEPVVARSVSAGYQFRKFVRRHRIAAAFLGMATVLSIISSGAALVAVRQKQEAQFQATQALQAQSRMLIQAAAQRLKDSDVADAQSIILEVLTNPRFAYARTVPAISVFQQIRAADAQLAVLSGHDSYVNYASYSPDGSRIVTASWDKTARIWDALTGLQLMVLSGHTDAVETAAYSPDGTRIVTASDDKTARVWDAQTGAQLVVMIGHENTLNTAVFSPDGTRIVSASEDKTARIWDAHTGAQLAVLSGHSDRLDSAAYSGDGLHIVTASADKTARIWDARTFAQLTVLSGHGDAVESAVYSPDGTRIVTASVDKTARIWDAHTGAQLMVLSGHRDFIYSAAYSSDGTHIVTASVDKTARIWDSSTGAQLAVLSGHRDRVIFAAYSPDGKHIVTASADKTVRVWDARTGGQRTVLSGHGGILYSAAFSPDGTRVVTSSMDKTARIWDARTGAQIELLLGHIAYVNAAEFSPDGTRIVTASVDRTARIWDAHTGRQLSVLSGHGGTVYSAVYSPDGTRIVTASWDKTARIWDARSGAQLLVIPCESGYFAYAAFSPDGRRIVTASDDKTARIWDARKGTQMAVLAGHGDRVTSASFSPDGMRIVTASLDKTVRIWDALTGAQLMVLSGQDGYLRRAVYSPDGTRIVTASDDKTARIWDARSGMQLAVLSGHGDGVRSATYSPDGESIATASNDKTARIWDARVQTNIADEIHWDASAVFDSLSDVDRTQMGLPPDSRTKSWPTQGSACDQSAAAVYDPDRVTRGTLLENIAVDIAIPACSGETKRFDHATRSEYELGRTLVANADANGARSQFETAVSKGYRAARVDLADLLVTASAQMLDPERAVSLYEQAWRDGVPIGAFRLGLLYENGLQAPGRIVFNRDALKAWIWFQRAADAAEPNALARFAERDERSALAETDRRKRDAQLFQAFTLYAAAVERAVEEDWPGDAPKKWRYHRATLAHLLAEEGMMHQVADAYTAVLDQRPRPTLWEQLELKVRR